MAGKSKMLGEFKIFITRGNVMDLAVGVIIGSAFTAIINSLVKDILMPFIGLLLGGVSFVDLKIIITEATAETAEVAIMYGNFIQKVVDFLIIAFVIFMIVRTINRLRERFDAKKREEEKAKAAAISTLAPVIPEDIVLLTEIRDLLKKK